MAALKAVPICKICCTTNHYHHCNYSNKLLDVSESGNRRFGRGSLNLRLQNSRWECSSGILAQTKSATTPVEDDKSPVAAGRSEETQITEARGYHKDLNFLPRPLSAIDLSSSGSNIRIAYKGVPGAYGEAAALKAYPKCETVPCDQFEAVFKAVELWLVDKAVLPIENSVGGSIHHNYELLLCHRLHIVGEVQLVVNHCLLGLPGVKKEELKRVLSHPQIIAAEGVRDTGPISSARAAEIYGLNVLAQRIQQYIDQDDSDNITRYLILAREPILPGTDRPHKTSIVFSPEEGPGVLFEALAAFALRDINLSKIEGRPQRKRPLRIVDDSNNGSAKYFDYLFYVDFEASMAEPRAQYALRHLQEIAKFLRVLGCYPVDTAL